MTEPQRRRASCLPSWDRNADAYMWAPDMSALYVQTTDAGRDKLYRVAFERGTAGSSLLKPTAPQLLVGDHNNTAFALSKDGRTLAWTRDATEFPAEVYAAEVTSATPVAAHAVTHENDALISKLALNPAEDFWFTGAAGVKVQGFLVKPPNWQAGKKYPAILLIHGGPQGAWLDQWHGRWNYQMFAATGAALVIINPRGSFGYGQKFVDDVSKAWGGKVYTDLMNGLDAALAKNTWIDRQRTRRGGRIVRRLHGRLDRRPHESLQGARVARRSVQSREHGHCHRGALVSRLRSTAVRSGIRRRWRRSIASTRRICS